MICVKYWMAMIVNPMRLPQIIPREIIYVDWTRNILRIVQLDAPSDLSSPIVAERSRMRISSPDMTQKPDTASMRMIMTMAFISSIASQSNICGVRFSIVSTRQRLSVLCE